MNKASKSILIILLGLFTIFGFALAQDENFSNETINQNQQEFQIPPQEEETLPQVLPKEIISPIEETPPQVLPEETLPETQLSENIADQKPARQFNLFSYFLYFVYIAVFASIFFWPKWWRKWLKRKKKAELPAEAEKIVCPTCGGSGKITKHRTKTAPCNHCKQTGIDICHYCGGTGRYGVGITQYPEAQDYMKCDYCGGKGFPKIVLPCEFCKGKRKIEYQESYEETCPTCKGSGRVPK